MRSWLTWLVGSVMHNLTPAFGEKFFWGHHGMSFIGKETNALPELVFQLKNNQTANQNTRTVPEPVRDYSGTFGSEACFSCPLCSHSPFSYLARDGEFP
jgi:hypothetical protein